MTNKEYFSILFIDFSCNSEEKQQQKNGEGTEKEGNERTGQTSGAFFILFMKTFLVLSIYDSLVSGKEVTRKEFCEKENIFERTFYRYMKNVSDFMSTTDRANDFSLKETDGVYRLTNIQTTD